jgi:flagellar biosynthesis chaperone FliJ
MNIKTGFFILILLLSFTGLVGQEPARIVEEVDVVNVMLAVRVFSGNEPVKGLTKEDFKLELNGKEVAVNGFTEKRQKIAAERAGKQPRLFVLVFNVSDFNLSLSGHVDRLFQDVIRPGDRLMVVSNNYFLNDRTVKNVKKLKKKLKRILTVESQTVRYQLKRVETELKELVQDTRLKARNAGLPVTVVQSFISRYTNIFEQYKHRYTNLMKAQGLEMANYLKKQDVPKWVIHFHQVGMFPHLKAAWDYRGQGRSLREIFDEWSKTNPWIRSDLAALDVGLSGVDSDMVNHFSQYFLNSGVTFHTLLMQGIHTAFLDYFDYKSISTNAEALMRKMTKLSGGETKQSVKVDPFIDKIRQKEDVYYELSYAPLKKGKKNPRVKVILNDAGKKYRLVYDDQQRPWYLRRKLARLEKKGNPEVSIPRVSYIRGIMTVAITNIKMGTVDGAKSGKIHLKIRVLDGASREQSKVEKAFKCKKNKFEMRMKPPGLKKGRYQLVVEVRDLLTGKNDISITDIKI